MKNQRMKPSRRTFMKTTAAVAGLGALSATPFASALGQSFPERNINVYVPTREGGGADRNLRAFTGVWKKYLGANFEGAYYPGAAGRVGYEKYMGLAKDDCYDLLFGNMGPEVLNWVVEAPTFDLADFQYFGRVDVDPGCVFVGADSPFQTIDELIEHARANPKTVTIGGYSIRSVDENLAKQLQAAAGIELNYIPYRGGKEPVVAVLGGHIDVAIANPSEMITNYKAGNLRALAVATPTSASTLSFSGRPRTRPAYSSPPA